MIKTLIFQRTKARDTIRIIFDVDEIRSCRSLMDCQMNDRIGYYVNWCPDLEELEFEPINVKNGRNLRQIMVTDAMRFVAEPVYLPQPIPNKPWSEQYSIDVPLGSHAVDQILGAFNVARLHPSNLEQKCCGVFAADFYRG